MITVADKYIKTPILLLMPQLGDFGQLTRDSNRVTMVHVLDILPVKV